MRPVNIYALTRISNPAHLQKLEKQMSGRSARLNIKRWEVACLKKFAAHISACVPAGESLLWFYSYQIPKLGKEFDLLRVSDDMVINVELKSDPVPDEQIKKQLLLNRYYLSTLGRNMRSYTYISGADRLVRLTNNEHLVEADWETLSEDLVKQGRGYTDHIDKLFREEDYLISPLTDPDRFLRQDYFLTSQQKDIRRHILESIAKNELASRESSPFDFRLFHGFTGIPGTGKTLLLYHMAMQLSERQRVCVLHYGSYPPELLVLDERLKRIEFFPVKQDASEAEVPENRKLQEGLPDFQPYSAILVDEGHRMRPEDLDLVRDWAEEHKIPVIFSYDNEDFVSEQEKASDVVDRIRQLPGYQEYRITNRIRTNSELASFIRRVLQEVVGYHRPGYPSVSVSFANDPDEAKILLENYRNEGFSYIYDRGLAMAQERSDFSREGDMEASLATCREFDKVVMLMDSSFYYDGEGYLRSIITSCNDFCGGVYPVYNVFHGLSRAKNGLAILILDNEELLGELLGILQGGE